MKKTRSIQALFLLALSLMTFLPFIGLRDIVTSHEARVVQVARQMAQAGWPWSAAPVRVPRVELKNTPDGERLLPRTDGLTMQINPWIVPVMNGQIRLQKPPLPYWCTAILYELFGFSEMASRIIPACLGALSILLVWHLARALSNRMTAWYAALVWVSSYFIVDEFRKSMADPYLAFFVLAAMWAWVRGWMVTFYLVLALAILAKGPLIFVFVPITIAAHVWCFGWPKRRPRGFIRHGLGLALLLVICLPWPIAVMRAVPNAAELWRYESIGALSDKVEDARPWWFYVPNLLLIALPWTPVWAVGLAVPFMHPRRRRFLGLICTVAIVLFFSCSYAKKNAYLLPLMLIQCLIVAQGLSWFTATIRPRPARVMVGRITLIAVAFSVAIQAFVSGFLAWQDNRRSPREAMVFVRSLLAESPNRSLLVSKLPEEAMVYLPLGMHDMANSDEVYLVADDRKDQAQMMAEKVKGTIAGPVIHCENIAIPHSSIARWKVYKLTISPIERPAPGAG